MKISHVEIHFICHFKSHHWQLKSYCHYRQEKKNVWKSYNIGVVLGWLHIGISLQFKYERKWYEARQSKQN